MLCPAICASYAASSVKLLSQILQCPQKEEEDGDSLEEFGVWLLAGAGGLLLAGAWLLVGVDGLLLVGAWLLVGVEGLLPAGAWLLVDADGLLPVEASAGRADTVELAWEDVSRRLEASI